MKQFEVNNQNLKFLNNGMNKVLTDNKKLWKIVLTIK